jgi:tetratricopeptide (TPR) repeat protein
VERLAAAGAGPPDTSEAHRVLGLAHQASGNLDLAVEQFAAAVGADSQNERARLALAAVLSRAGRAADARTALRDARTSIPASGQAAWRLGQMAAAAGEWTEAIGAFEQAAAAGPLAGSGALQAMLARARNQQGDLAGATRAFRARVAALPHDAGAHADLGGAYRAAGKLDEAIVEYLAAVILGPQPQRDAWTSLIELLTRAGRAQDAAALRKVQPEPQ